MNGTSWFLRGFIDTVINQPSEKPLRRSLWSMDASLNATSVRASHSFITRDEQLAAAPTLTGTFPSLVPH